MINYPTKRDGRTTTYKKTYNSWRAMKERCGNPNYRCYARYGGRGIKIDETWLGKDGFATFLKDMGERPNGKTLDRIDLDGNYCKENCRWADQKTQLRNSSKVINAIATAKELESAKCSRSVFYDRIKQDWSKKEALETPAKDVHQILHERFLARCPKCRNCGKLVNGGKRIYCSMECYRKYRFGK